MSKIEVNSNVVLTGVKIYAENGALFADLTGEAMSNIGPMNLAIPKIQLDFNTPEQTGVSAFGFKDGAGRVGYDFNFGAVLYVNKEDEVVNVEPEMQEDNEEEV